MVVAPGYIDNVSISPWSVDRSAERWSLIPN